jgi:hypothetical protein
MSVIKCKCGRYTDYGLTCTKCAMSIPEEPAPSKEEVEDTEKED